MSQSLRLAVVVALPYVAAGCGSATPRSAEPDQAASADERSADTSRIERIAKRTLESDPGFSADVEAAVVGSVAYVNVIRWVDRVSGQDFAAIPRKQAIARQFLLEELRAEVGPAVEIEISFKGSLPKALKTPSGPRRPS